MTDTVQGMFLVRGIDGLMRPADEEYDTKMDVEQDPTGARDVIHAMQAHIDAQDAKIKALVEALEHLRGLDGYEHIGAWFDTIDAALAAAKETT